ncbi:MAG: 16S rRNA (uracil(1498)-N(3))-methyltransferase [Candidatus Omnitrophica bacterium]|nr:16S rRNA (uracil(1498)-N(3))-methyltransferase [Candidatus Omnitrophota bacterium]
MNKFFVPAQNISQDKISVLNSDQIHHLQVVLRLKPGEVVGVFDGAGNEYMATIDKISARSVDLTVLEKSSASNINKICVTIACAIPKKTSMDDIIDKLTQLGADRVIPMITERVIVRLDQQKAILRKKRWDKISLNASQQSQRLNLMAIDPLKDISEVLSEAGGFDLKLIPTILGERKEIKEVLAQTQARKILVLIGPEGDFTPEEVSAAVKSGFVPVSLGETVLRVDTAAIVVAGFIKLYANN